MKYLIPLFFALIALNIFSQEKIATDSITVSSVKFQLSIDLSSSERLVEIRKIFEKKSKRKGYQLSNKKIRYILENADVDTNWLFIATLQNVNQIAFSSDSIFKVGSYHSREVGRFVDQPTVDSLEFVKFDNRIYLIQHLEFPVNVLIDRLIIRNLGLHFYKLGYIPLDCWPKLYSDIIVTVSDGVNVSYKQDCFLEEYFDLRNGIEYKEQRIICNH